MHSLDLIISFSGFLSFYYYVIYSKINTETCTEDLCVFERSFTMWTVNVWIILIIMCVFMKMQERYNKFLVKMTYLLLYFCVTCSVIITNVNAWNVYDIDRSHYFGQILAAIGTSLISVIAIIFIIYDMITRKDWFEEEKKSWMIKGGGEVVIKVDDVDDDDEQPTLILEQKAN